MAKVPDSPKIYHITHLRNLAQIVKSGVLWSDAKRLELRLDCQLVGMSNIKRRRLEELAVECQPGTKVGQYVPFYFCPRSIMLYILYKGNHPELDYRDGQRQIVHLQADVLSTIRWLQQQGIPWAFSDRNAGAYVASFYRSWEDLDKVNWPAVHATDFRDIVVKEGKQAEFLVYESFPWSLVERIGVLAPEIATSVTDALQEATHLPHVGVEPTWYF